MKVKIGNNIYDSNKEPIMLIFENTDDLQNVAYHLSNMKSIDDKTIARKYLQFPKDTMNQQEAESFMKI